MDLSKWPGTVWEPDRPPGQRSQTCIKCGQRNEYHGASEIVTRKLGLRLNQQSLVCRPAGSVEDSMVIATAHHDRITSLLDMPDDDVIARSVIQTVERRPRAKGKPKAD